MAMISYQNDPALKSRFLAHVEAHREADAIRQGTYGIKAPDTTLGWQGCAIACSVRSLDEIDGVFDSDRVDYKAHARMSQRLGVPLVIAYLEDRIFEGLPREDALHWPTRFARAIPVGKDLSKVWDRWAHWLLVDPEHGVLRLARSERSKEAITNVAKLYERRINGDNPTLEEWRKARADAYAAAYAYAYAAYAAYATDADADAAYADAYAANADAACAAAAYAYAAANAAAAYAYAYAAARQKHYKVMADKLCELLESA